MEFSESKKLPGSMWLLNIAEIFKKNFGVHFLILYITYLWFGQREIYTLYI